MCVPEGFTAVVVVGWVGCDLVVVRRRRDANHDSDSAVESAGKVMTGLWWWT